MGERLDHLQAAHRVLFHLLALCVRQLGGLEQDAIRQRKFADIMQRSELKNALDRRIVERGSAGRREVLGYQARVAGHAIDVAARFRVAEVHHVMSRLDCRRKNSHCEHFCGNGGGDQVGIHIKRAQHGFSQCARAARIEEDESPERAVEIHGHGIAPAVSLLRDDPGVQVSPLTEKFEVIHHARAAGPKNLREGG